MDLGNEPNVTTVHITNPGASSSSTNLQSEDEVFSIQDLLNVNIADRDTYLSVCATLLNYDNLTSINDDKIEIFYERSRDLSDLEVALYSLKVITKFNACNPDVSLSYYDNFEDFAHFTDFFDLSKDVFSYSEFTDIMKDYLVEFILGSSQSLNILCNIDFFRSFYSSFYDKIKFQRVSQQEIENLLDVNDAIFKIAQKDFYRSIKFEYFIITFGELYDSFSGDNLERISGQIAIYIANKKELAQTLHLLGEKSNIYDVMLGFYERMTDLQKICVSKIIKFLSQTYCDLPFCNLPEEQYNIIKDALSQFVQRFPDQWIEARFQNSPIKAQLNFLKSIYFLTVNNYAFVAAFIGSGFYQISLQMLFEGTNKQKLYSACIIAAYLKSFTNVAGIIDNVCENHLIKEIFEVTYGTKKFPDVLYIIIGILLDISSQIPEKMKDIVQNNFSEDEMFMLDLFINSNDEPTISRRIALHLVNIVEQYLE
ncbi:hypothetical protein TVAG_454600 [Trichomonas vaginalis G3]|uniref:Uncharacterized protein n=1 Tax=Trichomonas vaginalis (strain ATCC PRA-98 / G3) TaxID=412133 RepID=A2EU73_TRIV3|nr:hypothetical protein TVAGG3_0231390 [Trichomonas vaginalis G3]EAY03821.1 hypothetical protein TVAG_454600 [Trichomonas vaginalis G3]KAI5552657.1 hypothetical protein TVAGG3_0231390 [Trichomonas vaginalis G3]|eukprot:XP_001316044.1 hypothetical protein [Trichomonas vaginalis G3]